MRAVVDTNVAVTANGCSDQANFLCVKACIVQLNELCQHGKIILDTDWLVIREYINNLSKNGQPGVGDAFLYWVLQNWKNPELSELYKLEIDPNNSENFLTFPKDKYLEGFDRTDRKFAILALLSKAPVWNAVDSDWWDYRDVLTRNNIQVDFICQDIFRNKE